MIYLAGSPLSLRPTSGYPLFPLHTTFFNLHLLFAYPSDLNLPFLLVPVIRWMKEGNNARTFWFHKNRSIIIPIINVHTVTIDRKTSLYVKVEKIESRSSFLALKLWKFLEYECAYLWAVWENIRNWFVLKKEFER